MSGVSGMVTFGDHVFRHVDSRRRGYGFVTRAIRVK